MSDTNHPEHHVNEEPRNDFMDTGLAFAGFFGFLMLISIIATLITLAQN